MKTYGERNGYSNSIIMITNRSIIMLTKMMRFCMPEFIKKKKLKELFRLTADAFQTELPELRGLSYAECLLKYAMYTREQAERYLQGGCPLGEVKSRLYENSFVFGKNLRESLHIITWGESIAALKTIYRFIGIDFQYDGQDGFEIRQCFFSSCYSDKVCVLISSLDEGLAAGLSGGSLCFHQRITDGSNCCKGCLINDIMLQIENGDG